MYYIIGEVKIKPESVDQYKNEFLPEIMRSISGSGGKHIVSSFDVQHLTHSMDSNRVVVTEWPDKASAEAWWNNHGKMLIEGPGAQLAEFHLTGAEGLAS